MRINSFICVVLVLCIAGCGQPSAGVFTEQISATLEPVITQPHSDTLFTVGVARVAEDGFVYAYSEKSTASRIIGTAVNGVRFAVTEQTDSWCGVIYDGEPAFIPASKLAIETGFSPLPQHTAYYVIPEREEIGYVYKAFNNKLIVKSVICTDNKNKPRKRLDIYKTDGTLLAQDAALVIQDGSVSVTPAPSKSAGQTTEPISVTVKNGGITKCEGVSPYTDNSFETGVDTGEVVTSDKSVISFNDEYWEIAAVVVSNGTVYNATTSIDIEPSYYFEPKVLPDCLVDVRQYISDVAIDMVFAKDGNVMGDALYEREVCLLQKGTAEKLKNAQDIFAKDGYGIIIYDAYRPHSVTVAMFEKYNNPTYVARPKFGSDHNRGAAVDISLLDKNGNTVEMPSPVHTFSSVSHRNSGKMSRKARANMNYMAKVMRSCGFTTINSEWWHFSDTDALEYLRTDHDLNNVQRIIYQ
ncbi:MAG: M15 family metallopeptidase [Christensenellales bacterium]